MIELEHICKKNKNKIQCERRTMIPVDIKCQMDIIWIIWDIFILKSKTKSILLQKIIMALLSLFTLQYNNTCAKKRKYILYFAVSLLCENVVLTEEIIRDDQKKVVSNITNQIDLIYKQIKKNEEPVGNEYLNLNVKNINLSKTIEKLEAIDSFGEKFIPRI
jgi:hypothetical protein